MTWEYSHVDFQKLVKIFIYFARRSEEEEEINENSEISSSNNDKKTELYLSPFEAFYLSFGLGCLVVREEENDELHLTIGKKYTIDFF